MSQLTHSLDSPLLVRDVTGDYRPANADEVLQAAQRVLAGQMRGCEALNSPQVVRDFQQQTITGKSSACARQGKDSSYSSNQGFLQDTLLVVG